MRRAVAEYHVRGIETTLPFFERVLGHPRFAAGDFDTSFVDTVLAEEPPSRPERARVAVMAAAIQALRERQAARLKPSAGTRRSAWWDAGLREAHGRRGG
jgi:acetyl/propionyl-CoA carboxylase alpha subunit